MPLFCFQEEGFVAWEKMDVKGYGCSWDTDAAFSGDSRGANPFKVAHDLS